MARKTVYPQAVPEDAQEEMTVVIFKLKGQSSTLQKGFDAINTAFASFGPTLPPPSPAKRLANGSVVKDPGREQTENADEHAEGEVEPENDEDVIDANPRSSMKPKTAPRSKPKFLDTFDLNLSDTPWKEFAGARSPKSDNERYLVASLWITENGGTPEFTIRHVFTCLRAVGWPEQVDFSQPLRWMKSKKSYFTNPEPKKWKLTGPGLDAAREIK